MNAYPNIEVLQSCLVGASRRRGAEVPFDALLEAIGEAVAPRGSLAEPEVDFLIERAGVQASTSPGSILRANAEIVLAQAAANTEAVRGALSRRTSRN